MNQPNPSPEPAVLRRRLAQGFDLLRRGRLDEAEQASRALVADHAGDAQAHFFASEVLLAKGDAEGALAQITAAVAARPAEPGLLLKQAENFVMLRRRDDAKATAARAAGIAPGDPGLLQAVGRLFNSCDDPANARVYFERARAAGNASPSLLSDLATAEHFAGATEAAEANLEVMLAQAPQAGQAMYLRATLRRQTPDNNHVAALERSLAAPFPSANARVGALYALAKELEDLGEHARSFAALREGATLKRSLLTGYDLRAEIASIDAITAAYDATEIDHASPGHEDDGPIFVVGMPRTGTTLVERLLARHSEVASAGELLDFGQALAAAARRAQAQHPGLDMTAASLMADPAAIGRDYVAGAREAAGGSHRFVDKMPVNFIYCGVIRRALPNARIVHVVRDPMDTAYAVYKTLFSQAYPFSYDLEEIAQYLACYQRTMRHWHAAMPGSILDVRYEDLVADPEGQARRLLEGCGLEWEPGVLEAGGESRPSTTASAAQVREPIHARSVERWREHEADLAPLRARLVELGVVAG
jgi:tetratricopeptide (TPR) repeat protein